MTPEARVRGVSGTGVWEGGRKRPPNASKETSKDKIGNSSMPSKNTNDAMEIGDAEAGAGVETATRNAATREDIAGMAIETETVTVTVTVTDDHDRQGETDTQLGDLDRRRLTEIETAIDRRGPGAGHLVIVIVKEIVVTMTQEEDMNGAEF